MYFWFGLMLGIALMGMLAGLIIIWSDKPKRNCDIGSPTEQNKRFEEFCKQHKELKLSSYQCSDDCPCLKTLSDTDCEFTWSQMPYKPKEG